MRSDTLVALTLHVFMETKRILVFQLAVLGQEAFRSRPAAPLAVLLHRAPASPAWLPAGGCSCSIPVGFLCCHYTQRCPSLCEGRADGCSPLGCLSRLLVGEGAVFWVSSALLFGLRSHK